MKRFKRFLRSPYVAALLISGLAFIAVGALRHTGNIEVLELEAYDTFIRLRPRVAAPDPRIVLITISEKDIQEQGAWPLSDRTLARGLEILERAKPLAIGLDLFRDIPVPPGLEELRAILARNRNIIGVMKFGAGGVAPHPTLAEADQAGFNDILVDPGGVVRRALLFLDDGKTVFFSFPLKLALLYLQAEGIMPQSDPLNPQYIRLGQTTVIPLEPNEGGYVGADARGYQFLLDFRGAQNEFRSFSFQALLNGGVHEEILRGKIVLLGVVAQSVKDFFFTPLSRGFHATQQISGVALHAHIISQMLRFALGQSSPMKSLGEKQELIWMLLWGLMGGALGLWVRSPLRFTLWGLGGLLCVTLTAYLAFLRDWWIPLVPPGMTWGMSAVVTVAYMSNREKAERSLLMQLFSRHVSKEIAETIWQEREQFVEGGRLRSQKAVSTTLFSDLRGFTTVSEKMDPEDLMNWLNTYMECMARVVMDHSGIIDDYAGDGIKANFGVPIPHTHEDEIREDALNAVKCALAMEKEMVRLNTVWQERSLPEVGMRIGIFTGPVVAGLLGSSERYKYTTIGDSVNIASRLESYDKDLGKDRLCRILIGESTCRYVDGHFRTEKVGEVSLKGKVEKVAVYSVIGQKEPAPKL